jgi:hypothetical protein
MQSPIITGIFNILFQIICPVSVEDVVGKLAIRLAWRIG